MAPWSGAQSGNYWDWSVGAEASYKILTFGVSYVDTDVRNSIANDVGSDSGLERQQPERRWRSEEHTSELQSLMRISYAVFCLKKKNLPEIVRQETTGRKVYVQRDNRVSDINKIRM